MTRVISGSYGSPARAATDLGALYAAKNVTASVGNLINPILGASAAGVAAMLGLMAWWEIHQKESLATKAAGTNPNTGKNYTTEEIANAIPGPHSTYTDPSRPPGEPSPRDKAIAGIGEQIEMKLTQFVGLIRGLGL